MNAHSRIADAGNAPRILIVEDDPEIATMLVEFLSENGFSVAATKSGPEMDREMEKRSFDLVVLDAMLPGEDGFSICHRLRMASAIPILMLTALAADVDDDRRV